MDPDQELHLLPWHGQRRGDMGRVGSDLGYADGAMVDDDVLNRDQHQGNHNAEDVAASHHTTSEGFDHLSRRASARVAVNQNEARRGNVQGQPEQSHQQKRRGKTLNSTGRVMYIDTRSTITDRVM